MKVLSLTLTLLSLLSLSGNLSAQECSDRDAMSASMNAAVLFLGEGSESFKRPMVLKRHHPSKRKEVATYFKRGDLYYTLYWLVSDNCQAGFIKRTQGKY